MIRAIGLDLGTTTGWASYNDGLYQCGYWRLQPTRFDSSAMRFIRFETKLAALIDVIQPQMVFYEKVHRHAGTVAAHVYGGFLSTLQMTCERRKVLFHGLSVQEIKKAATGKGNAPKMAMLRTAEKQWPDLEMETSDVADAVWCLYAGLHLFPNNEIATQSNAP